MTRAERVVKSKSGVMLDISMGGVSQRNAVVMSPHGNVKHNPTKLPFPLPTGSVHTAVVTHVLEFIDPSKFYDWWNELHRVMRPYGTVYCSGPYGGDESLGWLSDPTHKTRVVEQSFAWLDPRLPFYTEQVKVGRKQPKPWFTLTQARVPSTHGTISYNMMLQPQPVEKKRRKR